MCTRIRSKRFCDRPKASSPTNAKGMGISSPVTKLGLGCLRILASSFFHSEKFLKMVESDSLPYINIREFESATANSTTEKKCLLFM